MNKIVEKYANEMYMRTEIFDTYLTNLQEYIDDLATYIDKSKSFIPIPENMTVEEVANEIVSSIKARLSQGE